MKPTPQFRNFKIWIWWFLWAWGYSGSGIAVSSWNDPMKKYSIAVCFDGSQMWREQIGEYDARCSRYTPQGLALSKVGPLILTLWHDCATDTSRLGSIYMHYRLVCLPSKDMHIADSVRTGVLSLRYTPLFRIHSTWNSRCTERMHQNTLDTAVSCVDTMQILQFQILQFRYITTNVCI